MRDQPPPEIIAVRAASRTRAERRCCLLAAARTRAVIRREQVAFTRSVALVDARLRALEAEIRELTTLDALAAAHEELHGANENERYYRDDDSEPAHSIRRFADFRPAPLREEIGR